MHEKLSDESFLLKKFILPANHIPELLKKLRKDEISLASLMPSYNFVVEQVKSEINQPTLKCHE